MKRRKINLFTAIAFGAIIIFTGCSKDDGAIPERITIEDVPVISTNLEAGGTAANITFGNQAAFQGKFKVGLFFPGAAAPAKVDIVVRKNGSAGNVKLYKSDVTALPANFTVTAAEIVTLFGAPLALNDTYDFAPDIYVGAKKYEAFPAVGLGSGAGVSGMSSVGFGEFVRFTVRN
ncbi:MAG: hypothetical protein JWP69_390 [Flaviaesturariibacter sp.]|nr:hypothetical protein [Flaviaesturariibacter sp.]